LAARAIITHRDAIGKRHMEQGDLKGKAAIVTGSATGIGSAVAIGLAKRGANVVVNYTRSKTEAEETADAVRKAGADVRLVQADVANDEDCQRLARAATDAWGRIDILVNNAGTTKFVTNHADLESLSADDFTRIYKVNVVGPFQMIRACIAALRAHKDGSVVNVSSIAGVAGIGSSVAYAASKGALNTMTYSLARALAPEVRVNAVCPGYVDTPWFVKQFGAETAERIAEAEGKRSPLQRAADGAEIAKTVLFFAGPESRNITGETLLSDTGLHLSLPGARRG
jgi:NAD(P)-dependent dehydrogenase (short-subunit alcohol dehydrogenase family)